MGQQDYHNSVGRDKALFAAIAAGDAGAFRMLFELYLDPLRTNAYKIVRNASGAEDIAQEVLAKVWEKRADLPKVDYPAGWLYKVCANACLQLLRRQERAVRYAEDILNDDPRKVEHPDRQYDVNLLQRLMQEAIQKLPEQQRMVYLLQQEEDLTYYQISDRLGISHHTVRNHLRRAYQSIRGYVQAHGEFTFLLPAFLPFF